MLTDRQWNQIKAALTFWQSVAESSRLHPMEHRSVRHLFEKLTPLTDKEITTLAASSPKDEVIGYPIKPFARDRGVRVQEVRCMLRRLNIQPSCPASTKLYRREDLERVLSAILAERKAFREKHTIPPEAESDPPERDSESIYPLWLRDSGGRR